MWISIMNLLLVLACSLLLILSLIGVRAILRDRQHWKEIKEKACSSGIKGLDE
jgi:hypothetical protein